MSERTNKLNFKVSVGIPTYNRVSTLKRAIDSVLNQDYQNIEVIISDNASTDETQKLCNQISNIDKRIKYVRQTKNLGAFINFIEVLRESSGEFFMWLGDDDWIDKSYISRCLEVIVTQQNYSIVCGTAKYFHENGACFEGEKICLLNNNKYLRVFRYYAKVDRNGVFYGIMKRSQLSQIQLIKTMGSDWLMVASMAFMGKILTLNNVSVHRQLGGATVNYEEIAKHLSLSGFGKRFPLLTIAGNAFQNILSRDQTFRTLNKFERFIFACTVSCSIVIWQVWLSIPIKIVRKIVRTLQ